MDKGLEIHSVKLRQIQLGIFEKYCTRAVVSQQVLVCGAVVVDKGGRDSRSRPAKYVPQRQCVRSPRQPASPPFLTRESSSWEEPGRESREKMGVTGGDQEAAPAVGRGNRGHQKGLVPTGGPKKITGTRKLLQISEEGGVSTSLTDDYITSVPRLQVEYPPMEGEEEEGEGGRRKPRYQFEIETRVNWRLTQASI